MSAYLSNLLTRTFGGAAGVRPLSASLASSAAGAMAGMREETLFAEDGYENPQAVTRSERSPAAAFGSESWHSNWFEGEVLGAVVNGPASPHERTASPDVSRSSLPLRSRESREMRGPARQDGHVTSEPIEHGDVTSEPIKQGKAFGAELTQRVAPAWSELGHSATAQNADAVATQAAPLVSVDTPHAPRSSEISDGGQNSHQTKAVPQTQHPDEGTLASGRERSFLHVESTPRRSPAETRDSVLAALDIPEVEQGNAAVVPHAEEVRDTETSARTTGLPIATRTLRQRPAEVVAPSASNFEAAEPSVHITIGRLEIRGSASAAAPVARPSKPASSVPSLEMYLRGRNQGRGRE